MRTSEMEESVRFKPTASGGSFNPLSMYPVGSIYQSVNPTDPAQLFGGTWQRIKDVFMMAAGDKYAAGSKGGEAEHGLTVDEMPSHYHYVYSEGSGTSTTKKSRIEYNSWNTSSTKAPDGDGWGVKTMDTGGSQPHNNLPPYLAVYTWVRTA